MGSGWVGRRMGSGCIRRGREGVGGVTGMGMNWLNIWYEE